MSQRQEDHRERIIRLDREHVWHPYTPMDRHLQAGPSLVVERAEGCRLFDVDGNSYIDANSSWWVALLGHNHPRLVRALKQQADRLCHVALAGITHEQAACLAQELCEVAPVGLDRVFYSDDGSTAVELAIKMCLQYWFQNGRPERQRFVSLGQAFHGETLGATALGGVEVFSRPFAGALMDVVSVAPGSNGLEHALQQIEQLLERDADEIAACVVEPIVQGAGGMRIYAAEYLKRLRELTSAKDVFLVVDEVFTGYGRTGPMWACEHAGIAPDVMCVAKGFTAGILPMAATLATQRLFDGFRGADDRALFYGHTYCGHPLGAAVAREVLAIYRDEAILESARPKAARIAAAFERLGSLDGVQNCRTLGMIGALNLGSGGYLQRKGWLVSEAAKRRGAYLRPLGDVVYIAPPLNIPDPELDLLLGIVTESVQEVLTSERV